MKKKGGFWILVVIVVVAAALAATFVSLFGNRNTRELAKATNSCVASGYLSAESAGYIKINKYIDNLNTADFSEEEVNELENFEAGYDAYVSISQFFNRQTNFMKYTKVYKNNRKEVIKKLKKAQKDADRLVAQINRTAQIVGNSEYWERLAWTTCRDYMESMLKNTLDAFNIYINIYQASVASKLLNNDYSDVMFLGLQDLSGKLKSGYKGTQNVGANLKNYAEIYFTKEGEQEILKYTYLDETSPVWATIRDIKENGKESFVYEGFLAAMPG